MVFTVSATVFFLGHFQVPANRFAVTPFRQFVLQIPSAEIAEWTEEQEENDPNFFMNFTSECLISFPEFAEWLKKRKATTVAESGHSRQNVA